MNPLRVHSIYMHSNCPVPQYFHACACVLIASGKAASVEALLPQALCREEERPSCTVSALPAPQPPLAIMLQCACRRTPHSSSSAACRIIRLHPLKRSRSCSALRCCHSHKQAATVQHQSALARASKPHSACLAAMSSRQSWTGCRPAMSAVTLVATAVRLRMQPGRQARASMRMRMRSRQRRRHRRLPLTRHHVLRWRLPQARRLPQLPSHNKRTASGRPRRSSKPRRHRSPRQRLPRTSPRTGQSRQCMQQTATRLFIETTGCRRA